MAVLTKAVFCDLIGVAVKSGVPALSRWLHTDTGVDAELAASTIARVLTQADLGTMSFKAFHENTMRELDASVPIARFRHAFLDGFGEPVEEVFAILRVLRKKGIGLYALSNIAPFTWGAADRKSGLERFFNGTVLSFRCNVRKPDPEFFKIALRTSGSTPRQTLLIDDTVANIAAAAKLGIWGIVFKTPEQLKGELGSRGLI